MKNRILVVLFLMAPTLFGALPGAFGQTAARTLAWPEIANETRPWGRWWWMGSSVNEQDITALLKTYKEAGLGGMEITPIYGVKGYEEQFIPYLSEEWMRILDHTLSEAEKTGIGIDMATGTGWPFGGPWVSGANASKYIARRVYHLKEGETLKEPVQYLQEAFVRSAGEPLDIARLKQPLSANKDLQALAIDQVRFEERLPLLTLMAYSESGESIDLTGRVGAGGKLDWVPPAGTWTLYALFEGRHGKMVERAAPGGEGPVIDHFSGAAIKNYLSAFDSAFSGHDISSLRAFFNDSYEVDDARGTADWTPLLLEEFEKRQGYDLRAHLPALFGEDTPEANRRVLCDYRETVSALLLEKFTHSWDAWAGGKNAIIRNQAHGSPANILDLYAASDIPETEGNDIMRFKFASSAGNVTGKRLISAESATWLNEHFISSLSDVKAAVDKFFIGGVNHIFYHGVNYSPQAAAWPGWLFYAAVHFSPSNPFWNDFAALNNYVARCQSFLQRGRPDNDILLYFPVYDRFSTPLPRSLLAHFDGMEGWEGTDFETVSREMLAQGYSFDLISDKQLANLDFSAGELRTGSHPQAGDRSQAPGAPYQVILLPQSRFIPLATMEHLMELARKGATILVHNQLPASVPGLGGLEERRKQYTALTASLELEPVGVAGIKEAKIAKGRLLIGNELDALLHYAGVRRESMTDQGLQFVRRAYEHGSYYFLRNSSEIPVDGWIPLSTDSSGTSVGSVAIFNPMNRQYGLAASQRNEHGRLEVYLQLAPGESCMLQTADGVLDGPAYKYHRPAGEALELAGPWRIDFLSGGPELPQDREIADLKPWTALKTEEVTRFSGTADYTISFPRPDAGSQAWVLDLGKVYHSARVSLNGVALDTLIGPQYRLLLDSTQLADNNQLVISVSNLMGNRIASMDRQGIPWKKFYNVNFPARLPENRGEDGLFNASAWRPRASGLAGPVSLRPVELIQPDSSNEKLRPEKMLRDMTLANRYFMEKWPDVGKRIVTNRSRASNIWTRAVYYEGLLALHELDPHPEYYEYAVRWGEFHNWNLRDGETYTRNADNQCAGQTYIDLYLIDPRPERIRYIKASIDSMMRTGKVDDWTWIDAIQMAMPVFARLGVIYEEPAYWERMYRMYRFTRDSIGDNGLFNETEGLWWRDADFDPPYTEPNGEDCYWSRGNGWVIAALARVLDVLPATAPHREEYVRDFNTMAAALLPLQRADGFWNVSLHDPDHFGGKELSGTALFAYSLAWGINNGLLPADKYQSAVVKAWQGMSREALHRSGFLGYVQSTGKEPKDGQPVTKDSMPDFEDYGLGAFLLAGTEIYKLTTTTQNTK